MVQHAKGDVLSGLCLGAAKMAAQKQKLLDQEILMVITQVCNEASETLDEPSLWDYYFLVWKEKVSLRSAICDSQEAHFHCGMSQTSLTSS